MLGMLRPPGSPGTVFRAATPPPLTHAPREGVVAPSLPHDVPHAQTRTMTKLDEREAVEQVCTRLTGRFPDVPVDEVRRMVHEVHDEIDGPVRAYVPVLVEHCLLYTSPS